MSRVTITKYPQSAFVIAVDDSERCAFDFGSESTAEMIDAMQPVKAVFVSHKHPDHFDAANVKRFGAPVYVPPDIATELAAESLEVHVVREGDSVTVNSIKVTASRSDHGPNISAPIDNLAFLIEVGDRSIFYAGDMAVATAAPQDRVDALLVPVGGSKVFTPDEALNYVRRFQRVGVVIPLHYHGRADRQSGHRFKEVARAVVDVQVLDVGKTLTL